VLPAQTRFLAEFTDLSQRLKPGVRQLRLALPDLNDAITIGTPVLERTPRMNRDLRDVFVQVKNLVEDPSTKRALTRLEDTFDTAAPLASFVAPTQTVCNYWNYWFTFLPEHLTERDTVGYTQRVSLISTPQGPLTVSNALGIPITIPGEVDTGISTGGYSGVQANGKTYTPDGNGDFKPEELPTLHANPVGPTGQDGSDCQTGQVGYLHGSLRLPGQSPENPAITVPDIPGNRGPTTEFFTRSGDRIQVDSRVASRQPGS
jgi:hypothetical protein